MERIVRSEDDIYMLYTGGTTGMPKGVMYDMASHVGLFLRSGFPFLGQRVPRALVKRNMVAVGGAGTLYLAHVNVEGKFTAEAGLLLPLTGTLVDALAYSDRYDRLYVAVKKKAH